MPALSFLGLVFFLFLIAQTAEVLPLAGWFAAMMLLQSSAGAFFTLIHRDSLGLLRVLPLYGPYNRFPLNSAWVISIFDEIRGSRIRW